MSIRFRRWSDGAEYEVATLEDFERVYGGGAYYIFSGPHATHTPEGFPIHLEEPPVNTAPANSQDSSKSEKPPKRTRKSRTEDANIPPESETTTVDDSPSGDESS